MGPLVKGLHQRKVRSQVRIADDLSAADLPLTVRERRRIERRRVASASGWRSGNIRSERRGFHVGGREHLFAKRFVEPTEEPFPSLDPNGGARFGSWRSIGARSLRQLIGCRQDRIFSLSSGGKAGE